MTARSDTHSHATDRALGADLRISVRDLAHRPGAFRRLQQVASVPGLGALGVTVPEEVGVDLDLRLEGVAKGVVVEGEISGQWQADCSRCLELVTGPFAVEVHELFEDDASPRAGWGEGDTYPLHDDEIDLEPLVRDAVLLELPSAPLCSEDCEGLCPTCGTDRNVARCACPEPGRDPRWGVLDELRLENR